MSDNTPYKNDLKAPTLSDRIELAAYQMAVEQLKHLPRKNNYNGEPPSPPSANPITIRPGSISQSFRGI